MALFSAAVTDGSTSQDTASEHSVPTEINLMSQINAQKIMICSWIHGILMD